MHTHARSPLLRWVSDRERAEIEASRRRKQRTMSMTYAVVADLYCSASRSDICTVPGTSSAARPPQAAKRQEISRVQFIDS